MLAARQQAQQGQSGRRRQDVAAASTVLLYYIERGLSLKKYMIHNYYNRGCQKNRQLDRYSRGAASAAVPPPALCGHLYSLFFTKPARASSSSASEGPRLP